MIKIPAGSFLMGSTEAEVRRLNQEFATDWYNCELSQHRVTLREYYLGKYPVTQEQYQAVMGNNPSRFKDHPKNPVECVSWDDAKAFCQKVCEKTGQKVRLPTEAEWEYACRAEIPPTPRKKGGILGSFLKKEGGTSRYCFGDDESQLGDYAWYDKNSGLKTHPVGQKQPNAWGLYDMHGNVGEWCEDNWHSNYKKKPGNLKRDGNIIWLSSNESRHVLRGGSWSIDLWYCRSAVRYRDFSDSRNINYGFRLVLFPP